MIVLPFLLLATQTVFTDDGCPYIETWLCGDLCILDGFGSSCDCLDPVFGAQSFNKTNGLLCCHSEGCMEKGFDEGFGAVCNGTTLPLTEKCHGSCNHFPEDLHRSTERSYLPDMCSETCVKEAELCQVGGRCEEEREWCSSGQRRNETCPGGSTMTYNRCSGALYGQCIRNIDFGDGRVMQCSDRSDEDPFKEAAPPIDTSLLYKCNDTFGTPGLKCGEEEECISLWNWCSVFTTPCPALGPNRTINDDQLCGNFSFWTDLECPGGHTRCSGWNSGECVWGVHACDGSDQSLPSQVCCIDGSNYYPPVENCSTLTCMVNYTQCDSIGDFLECNQEEYSEMKCLSESSICDTHPQCSEGEDEMNCEEEYRRKGYIKDAAIFPCQSPHHNQDSSTPTVFIWAVRCDGFSECWKGEDEAGCQAGLFVTSLLLGGSKTNSSNTS